MAITATTVELYNILSMFENWISLNPLAACRRRRMPKVQVEGAEKKKSVGQSHFSRLKLQLLGYRNLR